MIAGLVVLLVAGVGSGLFLLANNGGRGAPVATVGDEGFSPTSVEASAALPTERLGGGETTEAVSGEAVAPEPPAPAQAQALVPPGHTAAAAAVAAPAPAVVAPAAAAAAPAPPVGVTQAPVAPPVVAPPVGPAARPEPAPATAAESAGSAAPVGSWAWVVAGNYANVRSSGNSAAPILGTIAPGDSLQIEVSGRTWRQVRKGSLTGWVWVEALNLPGNR